jgi:AcrR family transcriptional regulator
MDSDAQLLISDLERLTGLGRSTIHYYLRKGMLSPPRRTAKTMAYYHADHVRELKKIRQLRKEGYPLSLIEKRLQEPKRRSGGETDTQEVAKPERRQQIMEKAVEVFARKGYHKARISDITREVGVGYSTFYLYFPSKRDLLVECVDEILQAMFSDVIEEIRHETHPLRRLRKRAEVAIISHPEFIDILSVLRSTREDDPRLESKRWELYDYIAGHVKRDLDKAVELGLIPPTDVEMLAYTLVVGILETATLLPGKGKEYSTTRLLDAIDDLFNVSATRHKRDRK